LLTEADLDLGMPVGLVAAIARHETLDTAERAGRGKFLLPERALREHAKVERGTDPRLEIDGHEGVVDDIGPRAVLAPLVGMVDVDAGGGVDAHRLVLSDQPHEIEEMAAFLDERAARARRIAIPVADLGLEGKAV